MGAGDEILAAGQAERWYREYGESIVIVDRHGLPRQHPIWDGNPAVVQRFEPGKYRCIQNGPHCRPYIVYPFTADTGWTFNRSFRARDHRAKIYLTDAELAQGRELRSLLGPYVLVDPWSKHPNLRWPFDHWRTLVTSRPDLTFLQHSYSGLPDDMWLDVLSVATPSFRLACGVLASAACYVRGESGMCHAAAALSIPQVTIWGGCMDWDVLGGYPGQIGVGISTPPCGSFRPCAHCATQMQNILVSQVSDAIDDCLRASAVR